MASQRSYKAVLFDIGGVLLTNGWDHVARGDAARRFCISSDEMEMRHERAVDPHERGTVSLDSYLDEVVFHTQRSFSRDEFRAFMQSCSRPHADTLELVSNLRRTGQVQLVAVSNEGRELTAHRMRSFGLDRLFHVFVASCFVGYRKPDPQIYRIALDVSMCDARSALYLDDRPELARAGTDLGLTSHQHVSAADTRQWLSSHGVCA